MSVAELFVEDYSRRVVPEDLANDCPDDLRRCSNGRRQDERFERVAYYLGVEVALSGNNIKWLAVTRFRDQPRVYRQEVSGVTLFGFPISGYEIDAQGNVCPIYCKEFRKTW